MIIFYKDPYLGETPYYTRKDIGSEELAKNLLSRVIEHAWTSLENVVTAARSVWKNSPSTSVRAVFGHWYVGAIRHLIAMIILSEVRDYSVVAHVHHRKIFENFIQVRYYASLDKEEKEHCAQKIHAIGCIEYLENLKAVKDHPAITPAYDDMAENLNNYDPDIVEEIWSARRRGQYKWFGNSYNWLAKKVSKEGEGLQDVYHIMSASTHGSWDLTLDVTNPEPGKLNFQGYPDNKTMYLRAAEEIDQAVNDLLNLWNEVAIAARAPEVRYTDQEKARDNSG